MVNGFRCRGHLGGGKVGRAGRDQGPVDLAESVGRIDRELARHHGWRVRAVARAVVANGHRDDLNNQGKLVNLMVK